MRHRAIRLLQEGGPQDSLQWSARDVLWSTFFIFLFGAMFYFFDLFGPLIRFAAWSTGLWGN